MKRIMFVCHGNICRSPMAEMIMKRLVRDAGLSDKYEIRSSATSDEEIGNPVYPPARAELMKHGIDPAGKTAVRLVSSDKDKYDVFVGMDSANIRNMHRILGPSASERIYKMMSFAGSDADVADPWFVGGFDKTYSDCLAGARGLLEKLEHGEI